MKKLNGKRVFITGAGSGMGLLAAKKLAAQGAHLVVFDRQPVATTHQTIKEACQSKEQGLAFYQLDVAKREQVLAVIAQAAKECGVPDIVINMAGIGGVAEFVDMSYETFDRMMQINVYGSRHVCEAVVPLMLAKPDGQKGQIMLVGSMGGIVPVYGYTAYGTSKFAVVGFAQCLRYELKPKGIAVQCFCPGEVATPGLAAERLATHSATVALKKIGGTMNIDKAVDALLDAIASREFMITPGWKTLVTYWAQRLTPMWLWNVITDAMVTGALRK